MEQNLIEPARIVTSCKIKTDVNTVKKNINFWNDLHRLGLTELREKASAATWHLANCVVAVREIEVSVTEITLLVARRQAGYQWVYGLQPEDAAHTSWNRLVQLMPREMWDTPYRLLEPPMVQIRSDIAYLVEHKQMSELARLVRISESAQTQFGLDASGRVTDEATAQVHKQIAQAETFKREQDAIPDLTPAQLVDVFWQIIPANKPPGKRVRRRTVVLLDPPLTRTSFKEGELPDVETMKRYYPDYNPETAKDILNALPKAWEIKEAHGGRWGPGMIAQYVMVEKGTISHYLTAFRKAGLRHWGSIKLP